MSLSPKAEASKIPSNNLFCIEIKDNLRILNAGEHQGDNVEFNFTSKGGASTETAVQKKTSGILLFLISVTKRLILSNLQRKMIY